MDNDNYRNILSLDRKDEYGDKVKMMCDFAANFRDSEVPDPYYGGDSGFDYVIELLLDACAGLLDDVKKEL